MSLRHLGKVVLCFAMACTPKLKLVVCLNSPSWVSGATARPSGAPGFAALSSLAQAVPKPLFSVLELCGFCAGIMSKP